MNNLQHRQTKILNQAKQTEFRDFVMQITSRYPLNLYKRNSVMTRFPDTNRSPQVISKADFASSMDSNIQYGIDYKYNQTFLSQLSGLFIKIPMSHLIELRGPTENAEYADVITASKNIYLSWNVTKNNQNVLYSVGVKDGNDDVIDSIMIRDNNSIIMRSFGVLSSYQIFYSRNINNCNNIWFSSDCVGCSECVLCDHLVNQTYCIRNKKYSKEEYFTLKSELLNQKDQFEIRSQQTHHIAGSFVVDCENVTNTQLSYNINTGHNIILSGYSYGLESIYNTMFGGMKSDCVNTINVGLLANNIYNSMIISGGSNLYRCYFCSEGCSFCLGCIGLKNKSYCILNKQYSKEERYAKVNEIFTQMDADGTLGEFFPAKMNPFYFNDTAAYLIDPSFTKEEVVARGYLWRDEPIKVDIPDWMEVVKSSELTSYEYRVDEKGNKIDSLGTRDPLLTTEAKRYINPIILKKTIRDEEGNIYRVIKMEYDFLVKYGLPLPRKHWLARMKENFRIN